MRVHPIDADSYACLVDSSSNYEALVYCMELYAKYLGCWDSIHTEGTPFGPSLYIDMSVTASLLIASNWKSLKTPYFWEQRQKMYFLFLMVKLSALTKSKAGNRKALSMLWEQWNMFLFYCCKQHLNYAALYFSWIFLRPFYCWIPVHWCTLNSNFHICLFLYYFFKINLKIFLEFMLIVTKIDYTHEVLIQTYFCFCSFFLSLYFFGSFWPIFSLKLICKYMF